MAALLGLGWASDAQACTLCSCSASVPAINFGSYNPTSASSVSANGTVALNCTGVVALFGTVEVRASSGSSGQFSQRTMISGAASLKYNLFTDSGHTVVFGDTTGGSASLFAPLNGLLFFNTSVPFYARLPASQWVKPGAYSDTVVITVSY